MLRGDDWEDSNIMRYTDEWDKYKQRLEEYIPKWPYSIPEVPKYVAANGKHVPPYPIPEKREEEDYTFIPGHTMIYDSSQITSQEPFGKPISQPTNSQEGIALKYDNNKTDWAILPLGAVEEIIKVMKFGESKYARGNFAEGAGLSYTRLLNALVRHTFAFMRGEDIDPESGLNHMAHAGCCILFILHYIVNPNKYTSNDDRGASTLP